MVASRLPPGEFAIRTRLEGHDGDIAAFAWSPNGGRRLASGSTDGDVFVWNPKRRAVNHVLSHSRAVTALSWSPDGKSLASSSLDGTVCLWDSSRGERLEVVRDPAGSPVLSVAWSPLGGRVAFSCEDTTVHLWDVEERRFGEVLVGQQTRAVCLAWSSDGRTLLSGTVLGTVAIWQDSVDNQLRRHYDKHTATVNCLAWAPERNLVASASDDTTVHIWSVEDLTRPIRVLTGHEDPVLSVCFTPDAKFLVSKSFDHTVRVWRCSDFSELASFEEVTRYQAGCLALHPTSTLLASRSDNHRTIVVRNIDFKGLSERYDLSDVQYKNAKVVIIGPRSAGKTSLCEALSKSLQATRPFETETTVWPLGQRSYTSPSRTTFVVEPVLWDCAESPSDPVVQHLRLRGAKLAVFVFDAGGNESPVEALRRWDQVLQDTAKRTSVGKILVAAKCDRETYLNEDRVAELKNTLDTPHFFLTSAREHADIEALGKAILRSIPWESSATVSSKSIYERVSEFLEAKRAAGTLLTQLGVLYAEFVREHSTLSGNEALRDDFDKSLVLAENLDLVQRFKFGEFLLLEPRRFAEYAAAMVEAAKKDPQQMGRLRDDDARTGNFDIPERVRVSSRQQEDLLLALTIHSLREEELLYRVDTGEGSFLVFPMASTRAPKSLGEEFRLGRTYDFEGAVESVYSSLVVRMAGDFCFRNGETWKNAAIFDSALSGRCAVQFEEVERNCGKLSVLYDAQANKLSRKLTRNFVTDHLQNHATAVNVRFDPRDSGLMERSKFKVFLSYNSSDRDNVEAIARELRSRDKRVEIWSDEAEIRPGDPITTRLGVAIDEVDVVLFFIGPQKTGNYQEVEYNALVSRVADRRLVLIPVILPNCDSTPPLDAILEGFRRVDFRRLKPDPYAEILWGITGERREK